MMDDGLFVDVLAHVTGGRVFVVVVVDVVAWCVRMSWSVDD